MKRLPFFDNEEVVAAIGEAADVVASGGVLLIPTESFYGLGAGFADDGGVARICEAKERPPGLGMPVLCADWEQVEDLVRVPRPYRIKLSRIWPAALTVVLSMKCRSPAARSDALAVRIPGHPQLRALLYRTGPLTGTSANRHGHPPCTTVDEALSSLARTPDLVLDAGPTAGGEPSTLVDLTGDEARVLRPGAVDWDEPFPDE